MTSHKLIPIQEQKLSFRFELLSLLFNHLGHYYIQMTIQNSYQDAYAGIQLQVGAVADVIASHQAKTDVTQQIEERVHLTVEDNTFTFILPKGKL